MPDSLVHDFLDEFLSEDEFFLAKKKLFDIKRISIKFRLEYGGMRKSMFHAARIDSQRSFIG